MFNVILYATNTIRDISEPTSTRYEITNWNDETYILEAKNCWAQGEFIKFQLPDNTITYLSDIYIVKELP